MDVVGISLFASNFVFEIVGGMLNALVIIQIYVGKIILAACVRRKRELNVSGLVLCLKAIVFGDWLPVIWKMMQRARHVIIFCGKLAQGIENSALNRGE